MPRLEFTHRLWYAPGVEGISLPVTLISGGESIDVLASVDTGASNCLFEREHADLLNPDIETGHPKTFWTATGRVQTFGHVVELDVLGLRRWSISSSISASTGICSGGRDDWTVFDSALSITTWNSILALTILNLSSRHYVNEKSDDPTVIQTNIQSLTSRC